MSEQDVELLHNLACQSDLPEVSEAGTWKKQRIESGERLINQIAAHNRAMNLNLNTNSANIPVKSDTQKKAERKERNRLSAERHRKKQREYCDKLE